MGTIIQFETERLKRADASTEVSKLNIDEAEALGGYRYEILKKAADMHQNPRAYTREERKQICRDLEYAQVVYEKGWSDEEAEANREAFDRMKDEEKKNTEDRFRKEWDMIYNGGENLTEFEKRQTGKYMDEHPEDAEIITGMVNMVTAGVNDPEHTEDYSE